MKKFLLIFILALSARMIYSQNPSTTCAGAVPFTINGACANLGGGTWPFNMTTNNAGGDVYTGGACSGTENRVAYYSITTGAAPENITITASNSNRNLALNVYSGGCAGPFNNVGCANANGSGAGSETVSFISTPLTTYIIEVICLSNNNMNLTNFCVTSTPFVVPNDNPCTATALAVNTSCGFTNTTNIGATASANPSPGCAGYAGGDVWFTVTVPASGTVNFDSDDLVMLDGGMAVYSGPNCSTLTLIAGACDDNSSANGLMPALTVTGQTPGATLWVRFWENGNNNNGSFGICAYDLPPASPTNCNGAYPVCNDASFAGNSSGFGTQELNAGNRGCLSTDEHQTTWFGFSPALTGTIQLNINPTAGAVDYDFAIWGPYPPGSGCPVTGAPLRCSYAAETGTTGLLTGAVDLTEGASPATTPRFVESIVIGAAQLGQVYYLVVDNYTSNTTPFTLDWSLSTPGMLDCTPPLPAEILSFNATAFDTYNQIHWATQSEINTSHFILEKSIDAVNFTELKRTAAAENSNVVVNYNETDPNPYPTSYYRLKQVDKNGDFKYYGPISITNEHLSAISIQNIYPNPADESFKIDLFSKEALNADLNIFDIYGRTVYSTTLEVIGLNTFDIQSSDWKPGVYTIKVENDEHHFQHIERIIIK